MVPRACRPRSGGSASGRRGPIRGPHADCNAGGSFGRPDRGGPHRRAPEGPAATARPGRRVRRHLECETGRVGHERARARGSSGQGAHGRAGDARARRGGAAGRAYPAGARALPARALRGRQANVPACRGAGLAGRLARRGGLAPRCARGQPAHLDRTFGAEHAPVAELAWRRSIRRVVGRAARARLPDPGWRQPHQILDLDRDLLCALARAHATRVWRGKMTLFRWIFAGAVIVLVGLAAVAGLKPRQPPPQNVKTALARRSAITSTVRAAGKLEPLHKVNVSSNITGTLLDLQVGIGSKVKKGQYLGQIDTSRYRAQVEQQHAQAEASEADVKREEANLARLRNVLARISDTEGKAFNVGEREQAQTQVQVSEAQLASNRSRAQVARAALREATNSLSWATLRAPVDGTVLSVNHRVGERVRGSDFAEDVVLVLGSRQTMDVRIDVGEHDVVHVRTGLKAVITVDALPKLKLHGEVIDSGRDAIIKNPGTDNEVTNFPVWVSMDDPPPDALS